MNKFILSFVTASLLSVTCMAQDIKLSLPDKLNDTSLMQALNMRRSTKEFISKEIDEKTLSSLLWAAYGVNRASGERTIPTAMNKKDLDIYIANKNGIYLYDADNHQIKVISNNNILPLFQTQEYMKNVPMVLIYVGSNEDYAAMHAGSAYQNVSLFAAAHEMGSVVRGYFDKQQVQTALSLAPNQRVIISQAVGYPVLEDDEQAEVVGHEEPVIENAPVSSLEVAAKNAPVPSLEVAAENEPVPSQDAVEPVPAVGANIQPPVANSIEDVKLNEELEKKTE